MPEDVLNESLTQEDVAALLDLLNEIPADLAAFLSSQDAATCPSPNDVAERQCLELRSQSDIVDVSAYAESTSRDRLSNFATLPTPIPPNSGQSIGLIPSQQSFIDGDGWASYLLDPHLVPGSPAIQNSHGFDDTLTYSTRSSVNSLLGLSASELTSLEGDFTLWDSCPQNVDSFFSPLDASHTPFAQPDLHVGDYGERTVLYFNSTPSAEAPSAWSEDGLRNVENLKERGGTRHDAVSSLMGVSPERKLDDCVSNSTVAIHLMPPLQATVSRQMSIEKNRLLASDEDGKIFFAIPGSEAPGYHLPASSHSLVETTLATTEAQILDNGVTPSTSRSVTNSPTLPTPLYTVIQMDGVSQYVCNYIDPLRPKGEPCGATLDGSNARNWRRHLSTVHGRKEAEDIDSGALEADKAVAMKDPLCQKQKFTCDYNGCRFFTLYKQRWHVEGWGRIDRLRESHKNEWHDAAPRNSSIAKRRVPRQNSRHPKGNKPAMPGPSLSQEMLPAVPAFNASNVKTPIFDTQGSTPGPSNHASGSKDLTCGQGQPYRLHEEEPPLRKRAKISS